MNHQYQETIR